MAAVADAAKAAGSTSCAAAGGSSWLGCCGDAAAQRVRARCVGGQLWSLCEFTGVRQHNLEQHAAAGRHGAAMREPTCIGCSLTQKHYNRIESCYWLAVSYRHCRTRTCMDVQIFIRDVSRSTCSQATHCKHCFHTGSQTAAVYAKGRRPRSGEYR
jgi:hypothetical protein